MCIQLSTGYKSINTDYMATPKKITFYEISFNVLARKIISLTGNIFICLKKLQIQPKNNELYKNK